MRPLAIRSILAATDLSDSSATVLPTAAALARLAEAQLTVVHVQKDAKQDPRRIKQHLQPWIDLDQESADLLVPNGEPARVIGELAEHLRASVIVLGPHRQQRRRELGSTADQVVRESQIPCLVVPAPLSLPLSRVLIPVDLTESACGAMLVGLSWASALRRPGRSTLDQRTEVTVLHVAHGDAARTDAQETLHRQVELMEKQSARVAGVHINELLEDDGDPARVVLDHAETRNADLVVLSPRSSARTPEHLLGSVSSAIVRTCARPMLLVPPEVWRAHAAAA